MSTFNMEDSSSLVGGLLPRIQQREEEFLGRTGPISGVNHTILILRGLRSDSDGSIVFLSPSPTIDSAYLLISHHTLEHQFVRTLSTIITMSFHRYTGLPAELRQQILLDTIGPCMLTSSTVDKLRRNKRVYLDPSEKDVLNTIMQLRSVSRSIRNDMEPVERLWLDEPAMDLLGFRGFVAAPPANVKALTVTLFPSEFFLHPPAAVKEVIGMPPGSSREFYQELRQAYLTRVPTSPADKDIENLFVGGIWKWWEDLFRCLPRSVKHVTLFVNRWLWNTTAKKAVGRLIVWARVRTRFKVEIQIIWYT